jgi:hypothetical protein
VLTTINVACHWVSLAIKTWHNRLLKPYLGDNGDKRTAIVLGAARSISVRWTAPKFGRTIEGIWFSDRPVMELSRSIIGLVDSYKVLLFPIFPHLVPTDNVSPQQSSPRFHSQVSRSHSAPCQVPSREHYIIPIRGALPNCPSFQAYPHHA